jgi:hypothetical protein
MIQGKHGVPYKDNSECRRLDKIVEFLNDIEYIPPSAHKTKEGWF